MLHRFLVCLVPAVFICAGIMGIVPGRLLQNSTRHVVGGWPDCNASDHSVWDCRNRSNEPDPVNCGGFTWVTSDQHYKDEHREWKTVCTRSQCQNLDTWVRGEFFCETPES